MAITINGTGSITGLTAGGLPDGSVVAGDLASSLDLTGKTVTLPSGTGGKILQVVSTTKTDTASTTSTSATAVSGLSASITPAASGNKILILSSFLLGNTSSDYGSLGYLYKDGSLLTGASGDAAGVRRRASTFLRIQQPQQSGGNSSIVYLDTAGGTSEITYQIYFSAEPASTAVIGRTGADPDSSSSGRYASTITLLEVAA